MSGTISGTGAGDALNLRRQTQVRRGFSSITAVKKNSLCLQVKFQLVSSVHQEFFLHVAITFYFHNVILSNVRKLEKISKAYTNNIMNNFIYLLHKNTQ